MEKYETISIVGEGSYGLVMKCRHRETDQLVAIKKFLETEDDLTVRKMALREIRMLKRLRHENLVNLLEVFRRKRRFYLVFEFMDHTILDELEGVGGGLGETKSREHVYQVARGIDFCHSNSIIHRDIKPENVLVSSLGVVKLCDFGFARSLTGSGETYTDYVATRWYRAPELLVPDSHYGKAVDIWAIGCLFAEMMTGDPIFPGDSDIDQLFLIIKAMGKLSQRHQQLALRNPMFKGLKKWDEGGKNIECLFPNWSSAALDFLTCCLKMDPQQRPTSADLLRHSFFTNDNFTDKFLPELRERILQEYQCNPLLRKIQGSAPKKSKDHDLTDEKNRRRSFIDPPRWKLNGALNDSRKQHLDLSKFVTSSRNKNEPMDIGLDEVENRLDGRVSREDPIVLSPLLPLQGVLYPTISNLSFVQEGLKHSPMPLNMKIPQGQVGKRSQIARRLDRPMEGIAIAHRRDPITTSPPTWIGSKREPSKEGITWKNSRIFGKGTIEDDFTLPNLPGATCSPKKGTKKKITLTSKEDDLFTTPRTQPSLPPSASSRSRFNPNFPHM